MFFPLCPTGESLISRVLFDSIRKSSNILVRAPVHLALPGPFFNYFYSQVRFGAKSLDSPVFSLSFDCDFEKDNQAIPKLLDVLESYGLKCDFAAIGKWVEKYPAVYRQILDQSHDIINHTYTHPDNYELSPNLYFKDLSTEEKKLEIAKCHQAVLEKLEYEMKGYRTPHFGYQWTSDVYGILEEMGYAFSSSIIASKAEKFVPYQVGRIWEFPISICPKHPMSSFDSFHVVRAKKHTPEEFLNLFELLIQKAKRENLFINLYFDPQDVATLPQFEKMLELVCSENTIKKKTLAEVL